MSKFHKQIIGLVSCIVMLLCSSIISVKSIQKDKEFDVSIYQNGELIEIKDNTVFLKDSTFDIVFNFSEPMGVLVNASFDKTTFKQAKKNKPLDNLKGFTEYGMADGLLNADKDIILHDEAPNYLYYDSDVDNRFNKSERKEDGLLCVRTIERFYEAKSDSSINIQNLKKDVYLVFISYAPGQKITERTEIHRKFIQIKWKNE